MAKAKKSIENLKPFKEGSDKRRNLQGRPTRLSQIENHLGIKFPKGANIKQVEELIGSMLYMSPIELANIGKNKEAPVIAVITASALAQSVKRGKTDELLKLIERVFGKPTEKKEISGVDGGPIEISGDYTKLSKEELRTLIELEKKANE